MLKKFFLLIIVTPVIALYSSSELRLSKSNLKKTLSSLDLPTKVQNLVSNYYGSYWSYRNLINKAVVIVPVADITTKSIAYLDSKNSAQSVYNKFSISPETGPNSCLRAHQILFNEVVTILQETDEEVEFSLDNVFYDNEAKSRINTFWTLKRNLKRLTDLQENLDSIPSVYGNFQKVKTYITNNIITLKKPWQDPNSQMIYSAGTRFVLYTNQSNKESYETKILNSESNQTEKVFIDKSYACNLIKFPYLEKISNFLQVLHDWSTTSQAAVIPYVWGGRSFISTCEQRNFKLATSDENSKVTYWVRPLDRQPYTGMDCSGLILRAAQICGLPYFYNNTTTLANRLRLLAPTEEIKDGDLIFFPGHVIIVSSIKSNEFIHTAGYSQQHGCLKICTLNSFFEKINTYQDFQHAYANNMSIGLLNVRGQKIKDLTGYKVLRIV